MLLTASCAASRASVVTTVDPESADVQGIIDDNKSRDNSARALVGFIYFFIALGMLAIVVVACVQFSWLVHFPANPKLRPPVWFLAFFLLLNIVSLAGGFGGWVVVGILFLLVEIGLAVFYKVEQKKQKQTRVAPGTAADVGEDEEAKEGAESAVEMSAVTAGGPGPSSPPPAASSSPPPPSSPPSTSSPMTGVAPGTGTVEEEELMGEPVPEAPLFASRPEPFNKLQLKLLYAGVGSLIFLVILTLIVFYSWSLKNYHVWSRHEQASIVEVQPNYFVAKLNLLMYAFDGVARVMRMNVFNEQLTKFCGKVYTEELEDDEARRVHILEEFIEPYDIDMSIYAKPSYRQYDTVNDWFIRELANGSRPIYGLTEATRANHSLTIVSPADARLLVFPTVSDDISFWIKSDSFTVRKLLAEDNKEDAHGHDLTFEGAAMAIVRLAPQDYHRFHSPVAGRIVDQYEVDGTLHSVNADAMSSGNRAIFNQRTVTIIETERRGRVAVISIGAVCVGSVVMTRTLGVTVERGEELGYFQFGGSTVVALFPRDTMAFSQDLTLLSDQDVIVETLVRMGEPMGRWFR